jgi:hypothetical protein
VRKSRCRDVHYKKYIRAATPEVTGGADGAHRL